MCSLATSVLFISQLLPAQYTMIVTDNPTALGLFLSNLNHAGLIHLGMNMLFLKDIYRETKDSYELKGHILKLTAISMILIPVITLLLSDLHRDGPAHILGISGVLCALFGLLLGIKFKKSWLMAIWIVGFHVVLIFGLEVKVAWDVHLIGLIVGYSYQKIVFSKIQKVSIKDVLESLEIEVYPGQGFKTFYDEIMERSGNPKHENAYFKISNTPETLKMDKNTLTPLEIKEIIMFKRKDETIKSLIMHIIKESDEGEFCKKAENFVLV